MGGCLYCPGQMRWVVLFGILQRAVRGGISMEGEPSCKGDPPLRLLTPVIGMPVMWHHRAYGVVSSSA